MSRTRRSLAAIVLGAGVVSMLPPSSPSGAQTASPSLRWERALGGPVWESAPGLGDVDGDGQLDVVVGSHDGRVNVLRAGNGGVTPHWPQPTSHAISSSPAVADTTGDGRPEIHVGSGTDAFNGGALYSFAPNGAVRWRYAAADRVFPSPSVHATPAIGDVDGDGRLDATVGTLGLESVHAIDPNGVRLAGFPFYWDDTVFSSPALVDVNGDGVSDIVIGGDSSSGPPVDHRGGMVRAIDGRGRPLWEHRVDDIVRGGPSVGDIDGDGRPDIVFGGGDFYGGADSVRVYALELDGRVKPGWPQTTDGVTNASPTLADLDGDGRLDVVIGTFDSRHGRGGGGSVFAWRGSGERLDGFPRPSGGGVVLGQIVTADLDGDGGQDVIVPTGGAVFAYSGRSGARLFSLAEGTGTGFQSSPLVADVDANGLLDIVVAGTRGSTGVVMRYELGGGAEVGRLAWTQHRRDARRTGAILSLAEARSIAEACPPGRVPGSGFGDVPPGNVHGAAIDCIRWWGVTSGTATGGYQPAGTVNRGQMATFIASVIERSGGGLPGNPPDAFDDDDGTPHEASINRVAAAGIVSGGTDGRYRPGDPVNRAQMATFLVKAHDHRTGSALAPLPVDYFLDDSGSPHEGNINRAATHGLTGGSANGAYRPVAPVARDQMASFLARLLDLLVAEGVTAPPG